MKRKICALSLLLTLCVSICLVPVRAEGASSLPPWYPASTENFPFFHDEDAPRVVDKADIFTDEEAFRLELRIAEIRRELQRDIVVYTDVTDYGLGKEVCAADFFDFNGYGYGDEREGVCLFIDMDPYDRGWWACCTGSETMGLYTEHVANLIDDALYEYMASGAYGAGVADWVENIRTLYRKGVPFAPEWYPALGETLTPRGEPNPPLVVDELGLLTEAEAASLTAQAEEIAAKRGVDAVIHIMRSPVGLDYGEVSALYYPYMGYSENGIMLTIFKREGYYASPHITAYGSAADKLSETNENRMRDACSELLHENAYYEAASAWLKQADHMERTGRVPRSKLYWTVISIVSVLFGSAFGGVSLGIARAKMAPPREKRDADAYFDPAGSRIQDAGRLFLYTSTARRYDPRREKSSGGGSSHGSSYRSSYSGSSGSSHSGSGRRF